MEKINGIFGGIVATIGGVIPCERSIRADLAAFDEAMVELEAEQAKAHKETATHEEITEQEAEV